jgi:hypothetical protein
MQKEQINLEIVPPVIVDENGDVQPYPSVESAIRAVEAVDVANNEYAFYDSTGRVLEGHVQKGKVNLVLTSRFESDSPLLRRRILQVLSLLGVAEQNLNNAPFSDLAHLFLKAHEKRRK